MTDTAVLQLEPTQPKLDFARCMTQVRSKFGKGLASQVADIARLSRGQGKLSPEEYFNFRLFDDEKFNREEKATFIGHNGASRIYTQLVSPFFRGIAHDKLVSDAMVRGAGLPCADTYAVYHRGRRCRAMPVLASPQELAEFLRNEMPYPCFSKPINGWQSRGVALIEGYDAKADVLDLAKAGRVSVETFASEIDALENGALFQEVLRPHPTLAQSCGERVSTLRAITLVDDAGASLYLATWKVPANANIADNFWRSGNLLADVDTENGTVRRLIRGVGLDQETLDAHPDTDKKLVGTALPDWEALRRLSEDVALLLPELRIVASDIGLTDKGPVVVEVNGGGDMTLPQLASGKGVMTPRLQGFVEGCGKYKSLFAV